LRGEWRRDAMGGASPAPTSYFFSAGLASGFSDFDSAGSCLASPPSGFAPSDFPSLASALSLPFSPLASDSVGFLGRYWTIREIRRLEGSSGASFLRRRWSAKPRTCVT